MTSTDLGTAKEIEMGQTQLSAAKKAMPNEVPQEHRDLFLEMLATTGNVTQAAQSIGVTRQWAYSLKYRDAEFAQDWLVALDHRRQHLVAGIDAHIGSHLEHDWAPKTDADGNQIYQRDGNGELILDEDLEPIPVMVSNLSFASLTQGRRSLTQSDTGNVTNVAVQTNLSPDASPPAKRPRLVMPGDIDDAEFVEVST